MHRLDNTKPGGAVPPRATCHSHVTAVGAVGAVGAGCRLAVAGIGHHVVMVGRYRRDVAETERLPLRGRRRVQWTDEMMIGRMTGGHDAVVHWEGGRLQWWRMRRRFRRRHDVVATHVGGNEWRLRRERAYRRRTIREDTSSARPRTAPEVPPAGRAFSRPASAGRLDGVQKVLTGRDGTECAADGGGLRGRGRCLLS